MPHASKSPALRAMTAVALVLVSASGLAVGMALPARGAPRGAKAAARDEKPQPFIDHVEQPIEGWTVHVDKRLLGEEKEVGRQALKLLAGKLYGITFLVPEKQLAQLREVPIWIDLDHKLGAMQYHPSVGWLKGRGYDPKMEKVVHIPNARRLVNLQRSNSQPSVVIHELSHAFHDRVLGFDNPRIRKAYEQAVKGGKYEKVLHISGRTRRHYALKDHKEYFAEATEAFFGTNDFYPFVRAELKEHDPALYAILEDVWGRGGKRW